MKAVKSLQSLKNFTNENGIIGFIILIGMILRFYDAFNIPFTHDEFSALFRTRFTSFNELIENGVKVDGHPALIQVFLFYYTKIVGFNTFLIKLPFLIMGTVSIFLIYLIGKIWISKTAGLTSASILASLQFTVMYSQIARPYISGLFFVLMMTYFWIKIIQNEKFFSTKFAIYYAIFACLSNYNHHFSLLTSFLIGFSGLFFVPKNIIWKYIGINTLIIILYIPHLQIFLDQLKLKGLESWLGKPDFLFLSKYFDYLTQFSIAIKVLFLILLFASLYSFFVVKNKRKVDKRFGFLLSMAISPLIIALIYSFLVQNILQFSIFIFSFPFLILLITYGVKNKSIQLNWLITLIILFINISSLYFERNHYYLMYNSIYEKIVIKSVDKSKSTLLFYSGDRNIIKTFVHKYPTKTSPIWLDTFHNESEFISFIQKNKSGMENIYMGMQSNINYNFITILFENGFFLNSKEDYFLGSIFNFSRKNLNPSQYQKDWNSIKNENEMQKLKFESFDSTKEWGKVFDFKYDYISKLRSDIISVSYTIHSLNKISINIVAEFVDKNDKIIDWRSISATQFFPLDHSKTELMKPINFKVYHSICMEDVPNLKKVKRIRFYLWNSKKEAFCSSNFKLSIMKGNLYQYGLFQKIEN